VNKRMKSKRSFSVDCGVVLFRTLYHYIEREPNRRKSCPRNQCHSAAVDGKEVGHDLWFLGVPFLADATLGRGSSIRSWSSSSLTGGNVSDAMGRGSVGFLFDEEMVAGCRSTLS
jgi:hypothetical protein